MHTVKVHVSPVPLGNPQLSSELHLTLKLWNLSHYPVFQGSVSSGCTEDLLFTDLKEKHKKIFLKKAQPVLASPQSPRFIAYLLRKGFQEDQLNIWRKSDILIQEIWEERKRKTCLERKQPSQVGSKSRGHTHPKLRSWYVA